MPRFDFRRRRRGGEPPRLGLVVSGKATNSEELILAAQLHSAILREAAGALVIFEHPEDALNERIGSMGDGEDQTFGNQAEFKAAMKLQDGDRSPTQEEALTWMREIEKRLGAIWRPRIEAAIAKGPDKK